MPARQADPIFGAGKLRVATASIQKDGTSFYPAGASLAGAQMQFTITPSTGSATTQTCVTDAGGTCPSGPIDPTATVTFAQLTPPTGPGLVVDSHTPTAPPCDPNVGFPFNPCPADDQIFTDAGTPPVAADDSATTRIDSHGVDVAVLANDATGGDPTAKVSAVTTAVHGTATFTATGVHYTPAAGFYGTDAFGYTLSATNGTSTAVVRVTVTAPPVATRDAATTKGATTGAGTAVTIDVLANDEARGGGALTLTGVGHPAHGSAVVVAGQVVYTPAAGFAGTDRFTYTISTADGTATGTVSVVVTAPPTPTVTHQPETASAAPLATTGTPTAALLGSGALLVGSGGLLAGVARRRRRPRHG